LEFLEFHNVMKLCFCLKWHFDVPKMLYTVVKELALLESIKLPVMLM